MPGYRMVDTMLWEVPVDIDNPNATTIVTGTVEEAVRHVNNIHQGLIRRYLSAKESTAAEAHEIRRRAYIDWPRRDKKFAREKYNYDRHICFGQHRSAW